MPWTLAVINPNASRLRDPGARAAVADALRRVLRTRDGAEPQVVEPSDAAEAMAIAGHALRDGATAVVGVGGDGTLKDLAEVLSGTGVPLGMVPGGTGNVLAGVLGVPGTLSGAVELLGAARPRTVDLGDVRIELDGGPDVAPEVRRMAFMVGAGIGFDARVMATTPVDWKRRLGRAAYFVQAAWLAARIGAVPYRVTVDGVTMEIDGSIALVTNFAELVPGVVRTRLPVVPDDGLFDVFVAGARNPVEGVRVLVDHLVRSDLGHDASLGTIRLRGRHVRLEALPHEPLQVDGDPLGPGALEATIRPGALRVLVRPDARSDRDLAGIPGHDAASEGTPG
jgi:diacylglycerol kinase (ATP)